MSHELEKALKFDPLNTAEQVTGADYKDDPDTVILGMCLAQENAAAKQRLLTASKDVHWRSTIPEYIAIIEDMGFVKLLDEPITDTEDRHRIFWRGGVLLAFDSYWGDKSINSAKMYCQFRGPYEALSGCSHGPIGDTDAGVRYVNYDAREALRHRLDILAESGEILPQWVGQPFLWLLHYRDTKQDDYDYKAINKRRMAAFPEHVREAICFVPTEETG